MTKLLSMLLAHGFTVIGLDCNDDGTTDLVLTLGTYADRMYIESSGKLYFKGREFHCPFFDADEGEYPDFDVLTNEVETFLQTL